MQTSDTAPPRRSAATMPVVLSLFLGLILFSIYLPGLSGGFLLDDYANLKALYAGGPLSSWNDKLEAALNNGIATHIGRPVALATFFFDANQWPAEPVSFKVTNVLIHVLNGLLLFWLNFILLNRFSRINNNNCLAISLIAALIWASHPLHVSTSLYVIQRMTLLSATFTIVAMIAYLKSILAIKSGEAVRSVVLLFICFGIAYPLAILCKENSVILPVLLLVLNVTVLHPELAKSGYSRDLFRYHSVRKFVIYGLTAALGVSILLSINGFLSAYEVGLEYTMYERLLTQFRILLDYQNLLVFPRAQTSGIYNDAYEVSKGIMAPIATIFALGFVLVSVVGATLVRKIAPYLSLAILFFYAAHLIESTIIPLELYFEHRNYLPSLFFFLPAVLAVNKFFNRNVWKFLTAFVVCCIFALLTGNRAALWGDNEKLKITWANQNPKSERANGDAANAWLKLGRPSQADEQLLIGLKNVPDSASLAVARVALHCQYKFNDEDFLKDAIRTIRLSDPDSSEYAESMASIIHALERRQCHVDANAALILLNEIIDKVGSKSSNAGDFLFMRARVNVILGDFQRSVEDLIKAVSSKKDCNMLILGMSILGSNGAPGSGLKLVDYIERDIGLSMCGPDSSGRRIFRGEHKSYIPEVRRIQGILQSDVSEIENKKLQKILPKSDDSDGISQ